MPDTFTLALRDWQNFYSLLGEASATLTGLMFVAASLGTRVIDDKAGPKVRTFLTPTIICFSLVLLLAALMNVPTQTQRALTDELGGVGLTGTGYALSQVGRLKIFHRGGLVDIKDWVWHFLLPLLAGLCLLAGAAGLERASLSSALDLVALGGALLVMIGLHNAWNVTLYLLRQTGAGSSS